MVQVTTDLEGPGSYGELVKTVKALLKQNFDVKDEKIGTHDHFHKVALGIVNSVLDDLNIGILD